MSSLYNTITATEMQHICENYYNENKYIIVNSLPDSMQECVIKNTIAVEREEDVISQILPNITSRFVNGILGLKSNENCPCIIVYGKNCCDETAFDKYNKLAKHYLYPNVKLYIGGLYEWICLQNIFGSDLFPTTVNEIDVFKFAPTSGNTLKL